MMRSSLWLFCSLGACAPSVDLILRPATETQGPTLTSLEFVGQSLGNGCEFSFAGSQDIAEQLPFMAPVRLPPEVQDCPVQLETRLFIGSVEVGRSSTSLSPGQKEATLLFTLCSNGSLEGLETCDDGNLIEGDGCDSTCKPTGCASGVATPGELCFAENDNLLGPASPLQVLTADFDGDEMIWTNRKFLPNPKPVPDDGPIIAYRKWCERFWPPDYLPDVHAVADAQEQDVAPEYAAS